MSLTRFGTGHGSRPEPRQGGTLAGGSKGVPNRAGRITGYLPLPKQTWQLFEVAELLALRAGRQSIEKSNFHEKSGSFLSTELSSLNFAEALTEPFHFTRRLNVRSPRKQPECAQPRNGRWPTADLLARHIGASCEIATSHLFYLLLTGLLQNSNLDALGSESDDGMDSTLRRNAGFQ